MVGSGWVWDTVCVRVRVSTRFGVKVSVRVRVVVMHAVANLTG